MIYPKCYFNGAIKPLEACALPLNDLGVIRGYAVFDYLRTYYLKPFLTDHYLDRFLDSAKAMHLDIKESRKEISAIIQQLIQANEITEDVGIRLALTGGTSADGYTLTGPPSFFMLIESLPNAKTLIENGIKIITHEYYRTLSKVKTTNYITAVKLQQLCKAQKANDVLFIYQGLVLETTRNNFFIVKQGQIITAADNILLGRTRQFVLSIAENLAEIQERPIGVEELMSADEAFTTGTSKGIVPVVQIDDMIIGNGAPGPITRKLIGIFFEKVELLQSKVN